MSWTAFQCENADFFVRSIPDDTTFAVNRAAMQTSEIFCDMFFCCDADNNNQALLDLHEPAAVLAALLRLLHSPPTPPVVQSVVTDLSDSRTTEHYDPTTMIPLPLLCSLLFKLVDKYALPEATAESLRVHLLAHAVAYPLQVYSFATLHGMDNVASEASQHLMPMASYSLSEIAIIPSVEAYHKIIQLQDFRIKKLRALALKEDIFPHGYGSCPSHLEQTTSLWNNARRVLAGRIEPGTDVAGEMEATLDALVECLVCRKAGTAAVEMLAYKCGKVPRTLQRLSLSRLSEN